MVGPSKKYTRLLCGIFFLLVVLFPCSTTHAQPDRFPHAVGYVNDFASVLDSPTVSALDAALSSLKNKTGIELAVVTVKTTGDLGINQYASELFKSWGVGDKGLNNGVLLITAIKEHEVRIEVGYGLEPGLTDEQAGTIIRNDIVPSFKAGDYSRGIYAGTKAIIRALMQSISRGDISPHATARSAPKLFDIHIKHFDSSGTASSFFGILFFAAIILVPVYFGLKSRKIITKLIATGQFKGVGGLGGFGGAGGGFGGGLGGFGGFGGGLSGGGGASFHW